MSVFEAINNFSHLGITVFFSGVLDIVEMGRGWHHWQGEELVVRSFKGKSWLSGVWGTILKKYIFLLN